MSHRWVSGILVLHGAMVAQASDLSPRAVVFADGETQVCWTPPATWQDGARVVVTAADGSEQRARPEGVCTPAPSLGPWTLTFGAGEPVVVRQQPWRWVGPGREPALLPQTTQDVAISDDGALWFARCQDGLTRLDPKRGTRRTWTWRDGLPRGCVTGVRVDDRGVAHAITPEHVAHVDPYTERVAFEAFDVSASVSSIHVGRDNTVWVGGQNGRLRGTRTDGQRVRFDSVHLGAPGTVEQVSEAPNGDLWLSSWSRVTRVDPNARTFEMRVPHADPPEIPSGRPGEVQFSGGEPWLVVQPGRVRGPGGELEQEGQGGLVHLLSDSYVQANAPGLPDRPTSVTATDDGALWITDERGVVRYVPERNEAKRMAVRKGHIPGGPWAVADGDSVWTAVTGLEQGPVLQRLSPDGSATHTIGPVPLPATGTLVRADDAVVLATHDKLWRLLADRAEWIEERSFGAVLSSLGPGRLRALHTGPSGRTWASADDGLHLRLPGASWQAVALPGEARAVMDVWETATGDTYVATANDLLWQDRAGRSLRVVDDRERVVAGVRRFTRTPSGDVWAWGEGGAWTLSGSDAVKQMGGPVHDLFFEAEGTAWAVGAYGVRRKTKDSTSFQSVSLPRNVVSPRQVAVRDGELEWVRGRDGLWKRSGGRYALSVPGEGEVLSAGDGTLWRWDRDGLHVLPDGAVAFRWAGLPARPDRTGPLDPAPIASDAITVRALSGVLAVQIGDVVVGDPRRRDPIVHLDVHGVRWAALSRGGVLLRGEAYRILERVYVPGPARRVALGPRRVCVAGTAVWCEDGNRWTEVIGLADQPAPIPAVDLEVDEQDRVWSLHPGALCREGLGCRSIRGPSQTALVPDGDDAWVGSLQGLYRVQASGRTTLVRSGDAVLDTIMAEDGLWLALEDEGVVRWSPEASHRVGPGLDPRIRAGERQGVQLAIERTGRLWLRQGDGVFALEPGWKPPVVSGPDAP